MADQESIRVRALGAIAEILLRIRPLDEPANETDAKVEDALQRGDELETMRAGLVLTPERLVYHCVRIIRPSLVDEIRGAS